MMSRWLPLIVALSISGSILDVALLRWPNIRILVYPLVPE
jgi:hypothetical protein